MTDQLGFDDKKASENISNLLKGKKMILPFRKLKHNKKVNLPRI